MLYLQVIFSLNDIMRFNKVFGTPRIDMEDLSMAGNPRLKATTMIEDKLFTGEGPDIASATEDVISAINRALKEGVIQVYCCRATLSDEFPYILSF